MKRFVSLGSRYIRTCSSAVSQTRGLASKAASQYPKTVIFTDFDFEGEEVEPQRRLIVQNKAGLKALLPVRELGSNVVLNDPKELSNGETYADVFSRTLYHLQGPEAQSEAASCGVMQRLVEGIATFGGEAKIELGHTSIMGDGKKPIMEVDGIVRGLDKLWMIKHKTVLSFNYGACQQYDLRNVKERIMSGGAISHQNILKGMDMCLVLASDFILPKDKVILKDWATNKGVPIYVRSAAGWGFSGGAPIPEAKAV